MTMHNLLRLHDMHMSAQNNTGLTLANIMHFCVGNRASSARIRSWTPFLCPHERSQANHGEGTVEWPHKL